MSGLHQIKLLAFVSAFKAWKRNSMWLASDKPYKVARALGMAESTVRKYAADCRRMGILKAEGGHQRFVSLAHCLEQILPGQAHLKHIHFFAGFDKQPSFKTYYERIKFALAELNYRQQAYRIERNKVLDEISTDRIQPVNFKRIRAMMKKHKVSTIAALQRTVRRIKDIVTGKYHTACLLGCSASTAAKLLRTWSARKWIGRRISTDFVHAEQCHGSMQGLMQAGFKYCYPDKKGEGYYLNRGSVITLNPKNAAPTGM